MNKNNNTMNNDGFALTTPEQISFFQIRSQISAIKLEGKGIRFRGGSVLAHVKRIYNLKGNRDKVLDALEKIAPSPLSNK